MASRGLLIRDARVVRPDGVVPHGWIATTGQTIDAVGAGEPPAPMADAREVVDAGGHTVLPGFIDVHVHGAVGHEVMDGTVDGLLAMSRFFATRGVTSFLATTWTATAEQTATALDAVATASGRVRGGARLLGAHLEGPYLSRAKCGAQDPHRVRPPDLDEARRLLDAGPVRLMTLAPELARARELVDLCLERGTQVSVGHTEATFEQVVDAASWGARHLTHTFNAMPPLHHRAPGPAGAAIMLPELLAELIADNHHVHPAVLRMFLRAKGADGIVLVTDALRPTGLAEGAQFEIGGRPAHVEGGVVRLADGTTAGSVLTMDVALRNLAAADESSPERLWRTASRNAAISAGVADRTGALAPGLDADLVLIDPQVDVLMTIVGGAIVYRAGSHDHVGA